MIINENAESTHTASKQWHHAPPERLVLWSWLCSTRYTAVQINYCLKRTSAIKVATMKITDDFCYELKPSHAYRKINTFHGEQR